MSTKQTILALALLLSSCAPIIYERPGTTLAEFERDKAGCQLTARAVTGHIYSGIYVHNYSSAAASGIAEGVAEAIDNAENFRLCMLANGYTPRI